MSDHPYEVVLYGRVTLGPNRRFNIFAWHTRPDEVRWLSAGRNQQKKLEPSNTKSV